MNKSREETYRTALLQIQASALLLQSVIADSWVDRENGENDDQRDSRLLLDGILNTVIQAM